MSRHGHLEPQESRHEHIDVPGGVPIKAWIRGVAMEDAARAQLHNVARLPFVHKWVAAMPDVHFGIGATVGSVIPTVGAIIPAAVGVDIGCGMMAVQTSLTAKDLPDDLGPLRTRIEKAVPHGRSGKGRDKGAWASPPQPADDAWNDLAPTFERIAAKHPLVAKSNHILESQVGGRLVHLLLEGADEAGQLVTGQLGEVADVISLAGPLVLARHRGGLVRPD